VSSLRLRRDSLRMRTPVLRGELGMWSSTSSMFLLKVWLVSSEPIATLRVTIANLADCVIGFKTGQEGIETWPNEDSLPPGWKNDNTRHEAQRETAGAGFIRRVDHDLQEGRI
jgi:hypothetical protein